MVDVRVKLVRVPSRLTFLDPNIIAAILNGRQLKTLELKAPLPVAPGASTQALRLCREAGVFRRHGSREELRWQDQVAACERVGCRD